MSTRITVKKGVCPLIRHAHDVETKRISPNSALSKLVEELQQEHWRPFIQEAAGREVVVRIRPTSRDAHHEHEYETQYTGSEEDMEPLLSVARWYVNTAKSASMQAAREAQHEAIRWAKIQSHALV